MKVLVVILGNIHETVQPTIHSLIDCLCCHITSTSWDELFSQSLISANNQHSRHDVQNIGLVIFQIILIENQF